MKNINLLLLLVSVCMPGTVSAQQSPKAKNLLLEVDWVPEENIEIFVAEEQRFRTVEALKKFLDKKETGTTVVWDPGCVRIGDKPLLSTRKEIKDLRTYLEKRGIKLLVIP